MRWIGSLSVGHPHDGRLINGVQLPHGDGWLLTVPEQAYGTDETIQALMHCIARVRERHPETPRAFIGSISAKQGGKLAPHKSHQSGRDVDFHFYLTQRDPKRWYEPATAENLDRPRNWTLLRTLVTETDVDMILIDRSVAALLEQYALESGEDATWIADLFHGTSTEARRDASGRLIAGSRRSLPLVKHVPGHTGHMHIRFVSPNARRRGRASYDQLVSQGHVQLGSRGVSHVVARGDTLIGLSRRFGVPTAQIQALNGLTTATIRVGQQLKLEEPVDLRGAHDPIVIPARRLPPRATPDTAAPERVLQATR